MGVWSLNKCPWVIKARRIQAWNSLKRCEGVKALLNDHKIEWRCEKQLARCHSYSRASHWLHMNLDIMVKPSTSISLVLQSKEAKRTNTAWCLVWLSINLLAAVLHCILFDVLNHMELLRPCQTDRDQTPLYERPWQDLQTREWQAYRMLSSGSLVM